MSQTIISLVICAAALCSPVTGRVYDGDTFTVDGETIRISNIDTPEIRSRCEAERRLALAAKTKLVQLLDNAKEVQILREKRKTWGRTLAVVRVDGKDVGNLMVRNGVARIWTGRRMPWC